MRKFILSTIVSLFFATVANTRDFSAGADLVSSYVWRGSHLSGTSIQPALGFSAGNFSVGAWGSVAVAEVQGYKELDLNVVYRVAGFSIGISDYWIPNDSSSYFNYDASRGTAHTFEANLGYTLPFEKFPLSLSWNTNFAGFDGKKNSGKTAWSSYVELSYPFAVKEVSLAASLGFTPWETDYYNATGFSVLNISLKATREIKIGDFAFSVFVQAMLNPRTENAFLVFGFSF